MAMNWMCCSLTVLLLAVLYTTLHGFFLYLRETYGDGDMCTGYNMPEEMVVPELCNNTKITMEADDTLFCWGPKPKCFTLPGRHLGYERFLIKYLKDQAQDWERPNSSLILLPKAEDLVPLGRKTIFNIPDENSIQQPWKLPIEDEDELRHFTGILINRVSQDVYLRNKFWFPLRDRWDTWDSAEEGRKMLKLMFSGKQKEWGHVPPLLHEWTDVTSDETFARFVFAGMPHMLVAPIDEATATEAGVPAARFMLDMSYMAGLETRPGYERYGGTAYFSSDAKALAIFWSHGKQLVRPGDAAWEHAKWSFRCTTLTGVTLVEHLVKLHLMAANFVVTAVREHMSVDHPVRRFLKPFVYRSISINFAASSALSGELGLLHRATSLSYKGLEDGFVHAYKTIRHNDVAPHFEKPEFVKLDEEHGRYPCGQDALEYYKVIKSFVQAYFEVYYPTDEAMLADKEMVETWNVIRGSSNGNGLRPGQWEVPTGLPPLQRRMELIIGISTFIWDVTGYHNTVGKVSEILKDPDFASGAIRPGLEVGDVQKSMMAVAIAVSTGLLQPRVTQDFTHVLLRDEHHETTTAIFKKFTRELLALSDVVIERNTKRTWPCNYYNPREMESAISI